MLRCFAAVSGRTYVLLSLCAHAFAVYGTVAHAQSGDAVPWEDREEPLTEISRAIEVNGAPLYLLSGRSAWGKEGAGVIGRNRSERAFESRDDFTARTGLPVLPGYVYGERRAGERWEWEWRTVSN
ncbi:MAG: hypothetical protein HKN20_14385, partial [Gemmatimonadetes bacterium]|nr:hypothetical protein [Gemmatimonadota bacterium]